MISSDNNGSGDEDDDDEREITCHCVFDYRISDLPENTLDYACTPEEVQQHFQSCGTVNRVTILTGKFGQPKGFAYVEFVEVEAVQNALLLNESELHGHQLKVSAKRTNVPGLKQYRGRRPSLYLGFPPRRPYMPGAAFYPAYGYGILGRMNGEMRYLMAFHVAVALTSVQLSSRSRNCLRESGSVAWTSTGFYHSLQTLVAHGEESLQEPLLNVIKKKLAEKGSDINADLDDSIGGMNGGMRLPDGVSCGGCLTSVQLSSRSRDD